VRPLTARDIAQLQATLLATLEQVSPVQAQNRLMAAADRDLGIALMGMEDAAVDGILLLVSGPKSRRVREEVRLARVRHVERRHVAVALHTLVQSLRSERAVAGQRSYLRPRHTDSR
jgi:hypothetical protein